MYIDRIFDENIGPIEKLNIELFNNSMNYEEREALFFYFSKNNIDNKYLINRDVLFSGDKKELKRILMTHGKENIYNALFFKSKIIALYIFQKIFFVPKYIKSVYERDNNLVS